MIKVLLFDFSRTLLFPKDRLYKGGLNELHNKLSNEPGYKFRDHFELNQELLGYLHTKKNKFGLYILTAEFIQESPEVKPSLEKVFKKIYSAKKIGLKKNEPTIYEHMAKTLSVDPTEILYIDDTEANITAANQADVNTFQYSDNMTLINKIESLNS